MKAKWMLTVLAVVSMALPAGTTYGAAKTDTYSLKGKVKVDAHDYVNKVFNSAQGTITATVNVLADGKVVATKEVTSKVTFGGVLAGVFGSGTTITLSVPSFGAAVPKGTSRIDLAVTACGSLVFDGSQKCSTAKKTVKIGWWTKYISKSIDWGTITVAL